MYTKELNSEKGNKNLTLGNTLALLQTGEVYGHLFSAAQTSWTEEWLPAASGPCGTIWWPGTDTGHFACSPVLSACSLGGFLCMDSPVCVAGFVTIPPFSKAELEIHRKYWCYDLLAYPLHPNIPPVHRSGRTACRVSDSLFSWFGWSMSRSAAAIPHLWAGWEEKTIASKSSLS